MRDDYGLRPLWDAVLPLYEEIARICKAHHITYYACGGTALGAVRHKGFIPWDDDLDLMMPRPDYDRFLEIAPHCLPSYMRVNSIHSDPDYEMMSLKVQETRSEVLKSIGINALDLYNGVFIDVFPIDGIPKNKVANKFYIFLRKMWIRIVDCDRGDSFKKKIIRVIRRLLKLGRNQNESRIKFDKWLKSFSYEKCGAVDDSNATVKRLRQCSCSRETFGIPKWVPFDRVSVPLPADCDRYLKAVYGDYMKLPPESQRVPSHRN